MTWCPWLCQEGVNISCAECEASYITHSVSSHGCFSVNSARTNFTVLKQLMVPKECVMSCHEIWLFPVCKEKTRSSLGLIRNNFSIKPTTSALRRACTVSSNRSGRFWSPTFHFCLAFLKILFNSYNICHHSHFKWYNSVACSTFTELCNSHHYLVPEHFHHPKRNPLLSKQVIPHSQPLKTTSLLSVSIYLPTCCIHVNGIIPYVAFCAWLLPLDNVFKV